MPLPGFTDCGVVRRVALALLLLSTALLAAGCGIPTGDVTGTVSYKGQPLKTGSVTFFTQHGARGDLINEDGTYTVRDVPCGEAKVTVVSQDDEKMVAYVKALSAASREKKDKGAAALPALPPSGTFALIPEKYGIPEQSGLSASVNRGLNKKDLELK
jgi:hypothetical protein